MGEIIINIPQGGTRTFAVRDPEVAEELLEELEALQAASDDASDANPDRVLGMWKDRFDDTETSETVARHWRREFWQRS